MPRFQPYKLGPYFKTLHRVSKDLELGMQNDSKEVGPEP